MYQYNLSPHQPLVKKKKEQLLLHQKMKKEMKHLQLHVHVLNWAHSLFISILYLSYKLYYTVCVFGFHPSFCLIISRKYKLQRKKKFHSSSFYFRIYDETGVIKGNTLYTYFLRSTFRSNFVRLSVCLSIRPSALSSLGEKSSYSREGEKKLV